jgi:hypothetical protein
MTHLCGLKKHCYSSDRQWKLQKNWPERAVLFLWGGGGGGWVGGGNEGENVGSLKEEEQVCKWCTLWQNSLSVPRDSLLSKCHLVLWYVSKCSFVLARMKSMACTSLTCVNTQMLNILCRILNFNQMRQWKYGCKSIYALKESGMVTELLIAEFTPAW